MFAGILDGMHAQDAKSTTNRREAAKLFNEHLKNQSDLGIAVTEESLSDAWNSNSGGVMQRHAPTQQRLQSIVTAQNKSLAEKQAATDFLQIQNSNTMRGYITDARNEAFASAAMPNSGVFEDGDYDKIYNSIYDSLPEGLREQYSTMSNQGRNTGKEYTAYRNQKIGEVATQIKLLGESNIFDVETVQTFFPNTPTSIIKDILASQQADREQVLTGYGQANATYERGVITWEGQQVTLKRQEQEAITAAARLLVTQSRDDTDYAMKLAKAEKDIARELITDRQKDVVFEQGVLTYNFNFEEATKDAAQKILNQGYADVERGRKTIQEDLAAGQQEKVNDQTNLNNERANANYLPDQLDKVNVVLKAQMKVNQATLESVTSALATRGITDQTIIDNTWNLVNATQSQQLMTEMTQTKLSNAATLAKDEANILKIVQDDIVTNQTKISNHLGAISASDEVVSAANIVAGRYDISDQQIGYFQDFVKESINNGSWEGASQVDILNSMSEFAAQENPTFASKKAQLVAQAKLRIGPDPYTPLGYKRYVQETSDEFNVHLKSMETASENKNLIDFKVAKGALTSLLLEMQADTKSRRSIPQKVFGSTVTPEEVTSSLQLMEDLVIDMAAKGDMTAPEEAAKEVVHSRPFNDELYRLPLNGSADLMTMDFEAAMSVINGNIERKEGRKPYLKYQQTMLESQKKFITSVEAYDLKASELKKPNLSFDEKKQIDKELNIMAEDIRYLQRTVRQVIRKIQ